MFPQKTWCKPRGSSLRSLKRGLGMRYVKVDVVNVMNLYILHAFKERMKIKRTSRDPRRGPLCQNKSYFKMLQLDENLNLSLSLLRVSLYNLCV